MNRKSFRFQTICIASLLIALVPMGIISYLAALDSRPKHMWKTLTRHNDDWYLEGQSQYGPWNMSHYWTQLSNGKHFGQSIRFKNKLDAGTNHNSTWALKRDKSKTHRVLEITDRFTDQTPKQYKLPVTGAIDSKFKTYHRYISNNEQASIESDQIELTNLDLLR